MTFSLNGGIGLENGVSIIQTPGMLQQSSPTSEKEKTDPDACPTKLKGSNVWVNARELEKKKETLTDHEMSSGGWKCVRLAKDLLFIYVEIYDPG